MPETLLPVPIDGSVEELAKVVQMLVGYHSAVTEDDSSQFPSAPRYDGVSWMVDYNRATAGPTFRALAGGTNHLSLTNTGATSGLNWTLGGLTLSGALTVGGVTTLNNSVNLGSSAGHLLTVAATATFAEAVTLAKSLTVNGSTTLGDNSSDTLTVNATASFTAPLTLASLTVSGALSALGNTAIGNAGSDTLTVVATSTFSSPLKVTDPTLSLVLLYADSNNNRTIVGSDTALSGAANDRFSVIGGRAYLAPGSEDQALGLMFSASSGKVWLGVSNSATPDLLVKNNGGTQLARALTGGGLIVGTATAMAGAEKLRVAGGGRFEGSTEITTGGLSIANSGNIDANAGVAGQLRIGAVIVNAASLAGSEVLRIGGSTRAEGNLTVTTGGIDITSGGLGVAAGIADFAAGVSVTGGVTIDATGVPLLVASGIVPAAVAGKVLTSMIPVDFNGNAGYLPFYI